MSRNIAITGASSEIGLAICERLIGAADRAVLQCHYHPERLASLAEKNKNIEMIAADFTQAEELERFCRMIKETDLLINAAAVVKTDLLVQAAAKDIADMLTVNIQAVIQTCSAVIPAMVGRRTGCIVNLSSVAAQRGNRGQAVYAGSKGFVEAFTRSLAAEYGGKGVRVNAVAPGPIESGSLKGLLSYASNQVRDSIVSNRLGTPQDVAALVAFLCSDEAAFINGKIYAIDGGFCRGV